MSLSTLVIAVRLFASFFVTQIPPRTSSTVSYIMLCCASPTLCDCIDRSPPGSSVHGISQARRLEWVSVPFSRGSSRPGIEPGSALSPALRANSLPTEPSEKPLLVSNHKRVFARIFWHLHILLISQFFIISGFLPPAWTSGTTSQFTFILSRFYILICKTTIISKYHGLLDGYVHFFLN